MMCTLLPITIDKLTLTAGQKTLLNNISLNITSSGILVIMGPNGAGKSLFMRCLHGLSQPDSGRILFAGDEINQTHRKSQALIFQKPVLLKRSVRQNLEFVRNLHRTDNVASIELALRNVGLSKLASQPANQLSGGERQRLALARALMMRPQMLFLDEACANLDPASVSNIEEVLRQACKDGQKIILITHDIAQAKRLADEVIFLHHGALCEHTPARVFFQSPKSQAARAYLDGQILV
ncbi:MAG: ATP-binding cassette domain-containing protein [Alphaproteobacteria bacterium]|nr:ATP-binding cassette domain-containing protein [Alphaproteobacteria bacterium]